MGDQTSDQTRHAGARSTAPPVPQRAVVARFINAVSYSLPAGTWMWKRAGFCMLLIIVVSILPRFYLRRVNRDLRRSDQPPEGHETLGSALRDNLHPTPTMVAIPIVAALDDGRYHWFRVFALVGLRAGGACPSENNRNGGSDMGRVSKQVLRANRAYFRPIVVTKSSTAVPTPSFDIQGTFRASFSSLHAPFVWFYGR